MFKPPQKLIVLFLFLGSLALHGCQPSQGKESENIKPVVNTTYILAPDTRETSLNDKDITPEISTSNDLFNSVTWGGQLQTFTNKTYGYTMSLPKSWGTIYDYSGYNDNINDDWETIGPYVPYKDPYITSEVFSDATALRKENQSWVDFYKSFRLEGQKYDISDFEARYPTKMVSLSGERPKTCLLMEHTNLYVFCFHPQNHIAYDMFHSIRFEDETAAKQSEKK